MIDQQQQQRLLFKRVEYVLTDLLSYIDLGDIGLPDIQRPFVWTAAKVRDLFDSMYKGFPVGYLLFWANDVAKGTRTIGVGDKAHQVPGLLIVDGQQRLTSLYAVFRGKTVLNDDYQQMRVEIAFRPRDGKFEVADAAIRKDPEFIHDISTIWASGKSSWSVVNDFLKRVEAKHPLSDDEKEVISLNLDRLFDLQKYPFTALEISSTVNEQAVADIFVRINSEGVTLKQADFILTLLSVYWDEGRTALEHFARGARIAPTPGSPPSPYNQFIYPGPDQLLRVGVGLGFRRARLQHVYSLLRGKDLETGEFSDARRIEQFGVLQQAQAHVLDLTNWHEFIKTLLRAGFLRGNMITSQTGLLYAYTFFLLGKQQYGVAPYALRNVIARWFFMSALTGRYSGSPESVMEQDLARLRGVRDAAGFEAVLDRTIADTLTEDYWNITVPNELTNSSANNPAQFAYFAALNLLEARVLFSKIKVGQLLQPGMHAPKSAIDRHHLFPKGYLKKHGITDKRDTNQIANYALVEWSDNIEISDTPPAQYYPKYAARFTTEELAQMHYWHGLPDGWYEMEYHDFLTARARRIAQVIRDGFNLLYE